MVAGDGGVPGIGLGNILLIPLVSLPGARIPLENARDAPRSRDLGRSDAPSPTCRKHRVLTTFKAGSKSALGWPEGALKHAFSKSGYRAGHRRFGVVADQ